MKHTINAKMKKLVIQRNGQQGENWLKFYNELEEHFILNGEVEMKKPSRFLKAFMQSCLNAHTLGILGKVEKELLDSIYFNFKEDDWKTCKAILRKVHTPFPCPTKNKECHIFSNGKSHGNQTFKCLSCKKTWTEIKEPIRWKLDEFDQECFDTVPMYKRFYDTWQKALAYNKQHDGWHPKATAQRVKEHVVLYQFFSRIRKEYARNELPAILVKKLDSYNFDWQTRTQKGINSANNPRDHQTWMDNLNKVLQHEKVFGKYPPQSTKLGKWINDQRNLKNEGKMLPVRKEVLRTHDFHFSEYDRNWQKKLKDFKWFIEKHDCLYINPNVKSGAKDRRISSKIAVLFHNGLPEAGKFNRMKDLEKLGINIYEGRGKRPQITFTTQEKITFKRLMKRGEKAKAIMTTMDLTVSEYNKIRTLCKTEDSQNQD